MNDMKPGGYDETHPTPQHIMGCIFEAIAAHNATHPVVEIPYQAIVAVRAGVRQANAEHEADRARLHNQRSAAA